MTCQCLPAPPSFRLGLVRSRVRSRVRALRNKKQNTAQERTFTFSQANLQYKSIYLCCLCKFAAESIDLHLDRVPTPHHHTRHANLWFSEHRVHCFSPSGSEGTKLRFSSYLRLSASLRQTPAILWIYVNLLSKWSSSFSSIYRSTECLLQPCQFDVREVWNDYRGCFLPLTLSLEMRSATFVTRSAYSIMTVFPTLNA